MKIVAKSREALFPEYGFQPLIGSWPAPKIPLLGNRPGMRPAEHLGYLVA
jgi:hypothetical protein